MAGAGIEVRFGRTWKSFRELQMAEDRLRERSVLGAVAKGCTGLDFPEYPCE